MHNSKWTNVEVCEHDAERGNSKQEDTDQPRQNQQLVPKRILLMLDGHGLDKSHLEQKTATMPQNVPHNS